jgi:hypothetical protein
MILLSLAAMLSFAVHTPFRSPIAGYFGEGVITLILGVVAVVGSKSQRVNLDGCIDRSRISRWWNRRVAHIDRRSTGTTFQLRLTADMGE